MSEENAVACRCGREPERDTTLLGFHSSLSCKCGGAEINFVARGKTSRTCAMNWNDLIQKKPFRNYVVRTKGPEEIPPMEWHGPTELPQRTREFFHGGAC